MSNTQKGCKDRPCDECKSWDCKGKPEGCLFKYSKDNESICIEEFYRRTQLCNYYHDDNICRKRKDDWMSFVDFAELLWHPKAYLTKTAFMFYRLAQKGSDSKISIPEEIKRIIDRDTIEECNSLIRDELDQQYENDFSKLKSKAKLLWEKAKEHYYRDEAEENELSYILSNDVYLDYIKVDEESRKTAKQGSLETTDKTYIEPLNDIAVYLEYTLPGKNKRIDILLEKIIKSEHNPNAVQTRRICVELKQWTESNLAMIEREDGTKGFKSVLLNGDEPDNETKHPLIQAAFYAMQFHGDESDTNPPWDRISERVQAIKKDSNTPANNLQKSFEDYIRDEDLQEIVKSDEELFVLSHLMEHRRDNEILLSLPLVYLHNQFYDNGILYDEDIIPEGLRRFYYEYRLDYKKKDGTIKPYSPHTIFTRHRCYSAIRTMNIFFRRGFQFKEKKAD